MRFPSSSKAYFTPGMDVVDAKLAASQFKRDYELLAQRGAVGNSEEALAYAMIEKIQPFLAKHAEELRKDIFTAQTLGKPIYTHAQLSALIAGYVDAAKPLETNVSESRKCNICGEPGCHPGKCKAKCPKCNLNCCNGARGEPCEVMRTEAPTEATSKNANGFKKPSWCLEKLIAAHTKYHETGKLEANVCELVAASADNDPLEAMLDEFAQLDRD